MEPAQENGNRLAKVQASSVDKRSEVPTSIPLPDRDPIDNEQVRTLMREVAIQ